MTTLFVGNLSPEVTDSDLQTVFAAYGRVGSLRLARNRAGRPRGFAYVELEAEAAAAAVKALKGTELKGRTMDVVIEDPSSNRRPRTRRGRPSFRRSR